MEINRGVVSLTLHPPPYFEIVKKKKSYTDDENETKQRTQEST